MHGNLSLSRQEIGQPRLLFLQGEIGDLAIGQIVQAMGLDAMDQLDRVPYSWDQVVPAPGQDSLGVKLQYPIRQWIAPLEVIEKPAIQPVLPQGLLDFFEAIMLFSPFCALNNPSFCPFLKIIEIFQAVKESPDFQGKIPLVPCGIQVRAAENRKLLPEKTSQFRR